MADWDTTNPDDNDIVSQYPSNERAARTAVVANFGVDHHETDDGDVGKHEVIQIVDNEGDATIDAGQVGIWNDGGVLKTRSGTGSVGQLATLGEVSNAVFPSGTSMLFHQATAPTGWTQDTSVNDRMIRVVSGSGGGGTGGTWTISGATVQGHSLTVGQMPTHNHGGSTGNAAPGTNSTGNHGHSGSANSAGSHSHVIESADSSGGFGLKNQVWSNGGAADNISTNAAGAHTHSISINSNGAHSHTVNNHGHSISNQGSGSAHSHGFTHDGSWRPAYTDVIVATKD